MSLNVNLDRLIRAGNEPLWQVAVDTGIHPSALSQYRHGHRRIGQAHADVLAIYFDVTVEQIRDEEPIPYSRAVGVVEL